MPERFPERYRGVPESELLRAARLTAELSYAVSEMVLEEPALQEACINRDIAWIVTGHDQRLAHRAVEDGNAAVHGLTAQPRRSFGGRLARTLFSAANALSAAFSVVSTCSSPMAVLRNMLCQGCR